MIGHFNAGELAGYRAGIVSGGKAARISAHLSSCSQCADVDSGLASVSQLLANTVVPPMPETLTRRLQAAIADEAAQRAAVMTTSALDAPDWSADGDRSSTLIPGRPDLPKRGRRAQSRPRLRVFSSPLVLRSLAAAGVAVLLVGGGIMLANQRSTTSGPAAGTAEPVSRPAKHSAGIAPVGSVAPTQLRYRHGAEIVYADAVTSTANYTKATLPAGVRSEAAKSAQVNGGSSSMAPSAAQAGQQQRVSHTTVGQLESCLATVATSGQVLLVEVARYLGQPASIIIFRPVGGTYDVIVVGEACGPKGQDIITKLVVPTS